MKTFDNVMVREFDTEKANNAFSELVGEPARLHFRTAVISEPFGTIVTEIVAMPAEDGQISVELAPDLGENKFSMFPKWGVKLTKEEAEPLLGEPMTLAEFVGDRRGYNDRLRSNERSVTQWLNE